MTHEGKIWMQPGTARVIPNPHHEGGNMPTGTEYTAAASKRGGDHDVRHGGRRHAVGYSAGGSSHGDSAPT